MDSFLLKPPHENKVQLKPWLQTTEILSRELSSAKLRSLTNGNCDIINVCCFKPISMSWFVNSIKKFISICAFSILQKESYIVFHATDTWYIIHSEATHITLAHILLSDKVMYDIKRMRRCIPAIYPQEEKNRIYT